MKRFPRFMKHIKSPSDRLHREHPYVLVLRISNKTTKKGELKYEHNHIIGAPKRDIPLRAPASWFRELTKPELKKVKTLYMLDNY